MLRKITLAFCCLVIPASAISLPVTNTATPAKQAIHWLPKSTTSAKDALTSSLILVRAGGYGGNQRVGHLIYSDLPSTLPGFNVARDFNANVCYLSNQNAIIRNFNDNQVIQFPCYYTDPNHNYLYWDADLGAINGGYSPENDALHAADVITAMFINWYGVPPIVDRNGMQLPIPMRLHHYSDNDYIDEYGITLGDGSYDYYPLSSLNTISYMIGDLFISQYADINWSDSESGGIGVAYSCMTAMAAEFYKTGSNTWQVGADDSKTGEALHYLDRPSKNCHGNKPGRNCDIDTLAQYKIGMSKQYTSGLYNRAFYLLANTSGWNTYMAYKVFVQASRFHWKHNTRFHDGACCTVESAKELGYDTMSVMRAFSGVGIETRDC